MDYKYIMLKNNQASYGKHTLQFLFHKSILKVLLLVTKVDLHLIQILHLHKHLICVNHLLAYSLKLFKLYHQHYDL